MRVHGLFIRSDETQSSWLTLARFRILFLCTICLFAVTARLAAQLPERPLHLEELEQMALASNPTVAQATAKVRAARGRAIQAGLYTNPIVGFNSDEISGGPIIRGGEWGAFFQQTIVTAGKLGLSRKTAEQEVAQAEAAADAQRQRVLNTVRTLYYAALAAQRRIEVRNEIETVVRKAVQTSQQLFNVGSADRPDVLEAELEQQRAELGSMAARNEQELIWLQMASAAGNPSLKPAPLAGNLEDTPTLDAGRVIEKVLNESPEVKNAQANVARAELALRRAQVEKIPNIDLRGGVRYNRELLEAGGRPVGLEGFLDAGVRIPIFDRNQGNVEAARSELEHALKEVERIRLSLRARLAAAFKDYLDRKNMVDRYRDAILPRAQRAYDLYLSSYRQMAAAYPQVLIAQRTLFQLQEEYVAALAILWGRVVEIQGFLLLNGLQPPGL